MAEKFSLVAQIQLQAPTNTRQVVDRIRRDLSGVSVQLEAKGAAKTTNEVRRVNKELKNASKSATTFATNLKIATQRAAGLALATRAVSALTTRIKSAVDEAISFQRELVKVSQVTGKTLDQLKGLTKEITNLSTTLGVSSSSLISVSRQLSQAGFQAADLQVALSSLAKTALAPTFDDITRTTEGAIAIFNQFGKGAAALEAQLGAINAVAGQFAVESGDLIGVVQRVGGVFKSAGGSLNELLALFTSVRATTRESSESIATGLRTIFTRIQRPRTIAFLKSLGVELTDTAGRFVGPTKAVEALNKAFADLPQGDLRFIRIAEELGGFRQIGKVIPLIQQFAVAQEALNVAQAGQGSLATDAAKAQQSLGVQIEKVRQEYLALIREFTESSSFKLVVGLALNFASALAKVLSSLKDVLPLLAIFGASRLVAGGGLGGLFGGRGAAKKNQGGPIGFARGGVVPGTGNRDTVPAMLTPGEFVIKKSSVGKIGAGSLAAMNENRYARGGLVVNELDSTKFAGLFAKPTGKDSSGKLIALPPKQGREGDNVLATIGAPKSFFIGRTDEQTFTKKAKSTLSNGINDLSATLAPSTKNKVNDAILSDIGVDDIAGKIFEGVTRTIIGDFKASGGPRQGFDIPKGKDAAIYTELGNLFNSGAALSDKVDYDNKLTESLTNRKSLLAKALNAKLPSSDIKIATFTGAGRSLSTAQITKQTPTVDNKNIAKQRIKELDGARERIKKLGLDAETLKVVDSRLKLDRSKLLKYNEARTVATRKTTKKAAGGGISGSDTVPALLTPGEFVINKKAAKNIGSANLNTMNKKGVVGFNKGGMVGFNKGGGVLGGGAIGLGALALASGSLESIFGQMGAEGSALNDGFNALTAAITSGVIQFQLMNSIVAQNTEKTNANSAAKEKEKQSSVKLATRTAPTSADAPLGPSVPAKFRRKEFSRKFEAPDDFGAGVTTSGGTDFSKVKSVAQAPKAGLGKKTVFALDKQFEKLGKSKIYKVFTSTESISQKVNKRFGDLRKQVDVVERSKKAYSNTVNRSKVAIKGLPGSASRAAKGLFGLKAAARSANRALNSVRGAAGGFAKKFGGLATKALPAISAALGVATAAAGYFAEQANKRLQLSIETGDRAGIVANAQSAQNAETAGSMLSGAGQGALVGAAIGSVVPVIGTAVGGLVGAIGGGIIGFRSSEDASKRTAEAFGQLSQQGIAKANKQLQEFSEATTGSKGISEFANSFGSTLKAAESDLKRSNKTAAEQQEIMKKNNQLRAQAAGLIAQEGFAQGKTFDEVKTELQKITDSSGKLNEAQLKAAETAFKVAAAQAELIKVNLDAARIGGATARAGTAVDNILASFETGSSALEAAFNTLETSTSTFGGADAGKAALGAISENINAQLDSLGIDKGSAGRQAVDRSVASSGAALDFSAQLSERLSDPQITRGENAEAEINAIVTGITSSIDDPKVTAIVQGSLKQAIDGATVDGQIDGSKVVESLTQAANKAGVPLKLLGEALVKQNKVINKITNERRAQEQKLMAAQSKAIDLQLEGARIIEQAGGPQLSTRDQLDARAAQASLVLRDAGVAGLAGTDTSSIRAASRNIANRSAQLNQTRGLQNRDDDRRPELKKANDGLIQFTRQRIKLLQQEMSIVKQKNALERSAIDALLSGDAEAFFKNQSASAAASALKSGNTALIRSLDASAVGAGLKSLQDQGTSSTELFSAARTAGLSQQQARIFSGTTEEETSLRRELADSGRTLGDLGNVGAELEAQGIQPILDKFAEVQDAFQKQLVDGLKSSDADRRAIEREANLSRADLKASIDKNTKVHASKNETTEITVNGNSAGGVAGKPSQEQIIAGIKFALGVGGPLELKHNQAGGHTFGANV